MEAARVLEVPILEAGIRLDLYLARELRLSRGYVRRLLARGRFRQDGNPAVKGTVLRAGDRVEVLPFRHPDDGPMPVPELALEVLARTGGLVAVDKPAGMATHPLDCEETGTALNAVLARYPEANGVGDGGVESGVVHRLDVGTSGVLLFATREDDWRRARACFDQRRAKKRYLARVHGRLDPPAEISLRLAHRGRRMRVVDRGGREATTRLRVLRADHTADGEQTLVEAEPITGRRHQLRATFEHLGHPILGDRTYGSPLDLGRHLLHATWLQVEDLEAESPPPSVILDGP